MNDHTHTTENSLEQDVPAVSSLKKTIEQKKTRQKKLKITLLTMGVSILVLASLAGYLQYRLSTLAYDESHTQASVPNVPKNAQEVIQALGRHVILPDESSPQIAEVQDVERLRTTQDFFKDAENGDIVIMYSASIYLYRPSEDRVVSMGNMLPNGETKP